MSVAELFVNLLGAYTAIGVLFAIAFVIIGIVRVDPGARHSTIGFRLIVLPGAALLWPLFLRRWIEERRRS